MKQLFIFLLFPAICFGQVRPGDNKYPFDFQILEELANNVTYNDTIIPVNNAGKFQYINSYTKEPAIAQLFDEAYPFCKGYGLIKKDGKYGIIDIVGNYVVKPAYYKGYLLQDSQGIYFETDESFIFNYRKLMPGYYGRWDDPVVPHTSAYKHGKKYGLVLEGKQKLAPVYDSILFININAIVAKKYGKIGIIGNNQKIILPFVYDDYAGIKKYWGPDMFAVKKGNSWIYIKRLKKLFESRFKPALINDNLLIFENRKLYNYFDYQGHVVLSKYYKWISANLRVAINQNDQVVIFNNKNEEFVYYTK